MMPHNGYNQISGHSLLLSWVYICCFLCSDHARDSQISTGDGQIMRELLFNRRGWIYAVFQIAFRIKYHNDNIETVAIFRRYLPLELILDQTQGLTRVSEPEFSQHTQLIEKQSPGSTFLTGKSWRCHRLGYETRMHQGVVTCSAHCAGPVWMLREYSGCSFWASLRSWKDLPSVLKQ